jgi:rhodanese-related sulfurtransferase
VLGDDDALVAPSDLVNEATEVGLHLGQRQALHRDLLTRSQTKSIRRPDRTDAPRVDGTASGSIEVLIVAYCRGPHCVLAPQALALLRARGFRARRLEDGLPEWRAAGLPIASNS